jgi:queuine tRNA-ribosyltransferase
MNMPRLIRTAHGSIECPAFLPDATRGVVRAVDGDDLRGCHVPGLVTSTFHLMQRPGSTTIVALGGLHAMMAWRGPVMTDSGGFQAYSIIRDHPRDGNITDDGIHFWPEGRTRKFSLAPEKSIRLQVSYGADIVVCLDQCTHADDPDDVQEASVRRTIAWAKRGKTELERLRCQKNATLDTWPLLFGVIQGGRSLDLRRRCADALLALDVQGLAFGGWPVASDGHLLVDLIAFTRELTPASLPFHALGIGHPESIVACARVGCDLFDSALPTRDARRGRLYTFAGDAPARANDFTPGWFAFLYIQDDRHTKSEMPIVPGCECACCQMHSIGYLHHLFKIGDTLFARLATIHNLFFIHQVTETFRKSPPTV